MDKIYLSAARRGWIIFLVDTDLVDVAKPTMRKPRSPSPINFPPNKAANNIDTSRAGATCESGAICTAYSTST